MSLGAAYLAGGMAQHAANHSRVERIAQAAEGAYSDSALLQDANVLRLTQVPGEGGQGYGQSRQLTQLTERLERRGAAPTAARELDCLTQAVYYEARGESSRGQFAVAQVVMNRVKHPAFPKTVCGVVFQGAGRRGCQFSFACDGSMRGRREAAAWDRARKVAGRVLAGAAIADIGSATHFHTTAVAPAWGPQMRRVAQVGMHVFYRFNPRGVMQAAGEPVIQPAELRLTSAVLDKAADGAPQGHASDPAAQAPAAEGKPASPAAKPAEAAALKISQPADAAVS
ncbi:cell wall hydrolase [Phenylobacterium sp.]|uniref:cell wall hydrolase n=1 Tax=Phenylobacterium sp. TaxID=1871053 RepID=UPI00391A2046